MLSLCLLIIIILLDLICCSNYFIDDDFKEAKETHPFPVDGNACSADGVSTEYGLLSMLGSNHYLQYRCENNSVIKQVM